VLLAQRDRPRMDTCELAARLRKARIERVQAEQRAVRLRREDALMLLQRCRILRSRQGRAKQQCRSEREPEREAALPSTTHEAGPYQRTRLVVMVTNRNVLTMFRPGNRRIP
jgi:hypothetical protein